MEETVIELSRALDPGTAGVLRLDRSRSSLDPEVDTAEKQGPVPMPDGRVSLRVLVDRSALEIFANGKPLTARSYPTLAGDGLGLAVSNGTAILIKGEVWTMADTFAGPRPVLP